MEGIMKKIQYTINFIEIDNYQVITSIENPTPDPEETNKAVEAMILQNPDVLLKKTRDELLAENVVFAHLVSGQKNVYKTEGEKLISSFGLLKENERLLLSGDIITDIRNKEYWLKQSKIWKLYTIEHFGETLPEDAVLPTDLSPAQQNEIAEQKEADRIANLTPEERAEEKEATLAAARQRVRILKEEAEIADEPFDAKAEYQAQKAKIEKLYA
jgi:hypothetical protein